MTPEDLIPANILPKWLAPTLIGVCLVVGGLWAHSCYNRREVANQTQQADQSHASGVVHQTEGTVYDAQAQAQADELKAAAAEVARLRAEVARLRRAAAQVPAVSQPAAVPEPAPTPTQPPVDPALVAKLDELVQAQDREIGGLKAQVMTLTSSRDSWKLAAQDFQRAELQTRAALAAQQGLTRNALWKGRLQGLAVGLGTGCVIGRAQR